MNEETKIALKISKFIQQYQQTIVAIYQCRASTIKSTSSSRPELTSTCSRHVES